MKNKNFILALAGFGMSVLFISLLSRGCNRSGKIKKSGNENASTQGMKVDPVIGADDQSVGKDKTIDRTARSAISIKQIKNSAGDKLVSCFARSTTSISNGNGSNYIKNDKGDVLLKCEGNIGTVRQSPDETKFVVFCYPKWKIFRINYHDANEIEDNLPDLGDIEWLWCGNSQLIGILQIYEESKRPEIEDVFVKNTNLYLYDIESKETHEIAWPNIPMQKGEFIRMNGVSLSGEIELSIVNPDQYFDVSLYNRQLGRFSVSRP